MIHRDLKPSNVILTADGPKVIDFGIARAADATSVTGTGVVPGTPAFMAPEHVLGQTLTPAADVFALGIVANFAATGELAFGGGSGHAVVHRILEQEPNLDGCPEPIRTIAAACLAKDPQQRPGLAEVIRRCRQAPTDGDAHPAPGLPGPGLTPSIPPSDTARGFAPPGAPVVAPHAPHAPHPNPPQPIPTTRPSTASGPRLTRRRVLLIAGVGGGVGLGAAAGLLVPSFRSGSGPGPEPLFELTATLSVPDGGTDLAVFSPDGRTVASSFTYTVTLWDVAGRRKSATMTSLTQKSGAFVEDVAFSPDGRLLATAGSVDIPEGKSSTSGMLRVWDVAGRRQRASLTGGFQILNALAFSPDRVRLAAASQDGTVELWHADNFDEITTFPAHTSPIADLAFSPNGQIMATAGGNGISPTHGTVKLWDMSGIERRHATLDHGAGIVVSSLAFSPNGRLLATAGGDRTVRLWKARS